MQLHARIQYCVHKAISVELQEPGKTNADWLGRSGFAQPQPESQVSVESTSTGNEASGNKESEMVCAQQSWNYHQDVKIQTSDMQAACAQLLVNAT